MKKNIIVTSLFSCLISFGFSQTTISLQPDAISGKDAIILDYQADTNRGVSPQFVIYAWTWGSTPTILRGLIDFDFSSIPTGATITSANLYLFNDDGSASSNGEHSQLDGSNEMVIERITDFWDENTVTWNNQPNATTQNQIIVPPSTSVHQNYMVNVTSLVQDIVDNPSTSFGFKLKLLTEQNYRSVVFASSDHTDTTLHPKIEISYTNPLGTENVSNFNDLLKIYPNPASNQLSIDTKFSINEIKIYDISGQMIKTIGQNTNTVNVAELQTGIYLVKVITETNTFTKMFVKQ